MARRSDHSREELKILILNAAQLLLEKGGIYAVTARNIAQEIGYTPGTIYNLFANLDDVILQVNLRTLDDLEAALLNQPDVAAIARSYYAFACAHSHRWRALFEHQMQSGDQVPEWYQERVHAMISAVEKQMHGMVPSISAKTFWAAVHGVCMLALLGTLNVTGDDPLLLLDDIVARYA